MRYNIYKSIINRTDNEVNNSNNDGGLIDCHDPEGGSTCEGGDLMQHKQRQNQSLRLKTLGRFLGIVPREGDPDGC